MKTNIRLNNRIVGTFDDRTSTLYRTIHGSRHFLRQPPAIAFETSVIWQAGCLGCTSVEVKDSESGKVFKTSFSTIEEKGLKINFGVGPQIALPLCYWSTGESWQTTPKAYSVSATPQVKQLSLFPDSGGW